MPDKPEPPEWNPYRYHPNGYAGDMFWDATAPFVLITIILILTGLIVWGIWG